MTFETWARDVQRYMRGWGCSWAMAEWRLSEAYRSAAHSTVLEIGYDPAVRHYWWRGR